MKKEYLSPMLEYTERRNANRICNDEDEIVTIDVSGVIQEDYGYTD